MTATCEPTTTLAENTAADERPTTGARVRLVVEDSYLREHASGYKGAMGTVVEHDSSGRGMYVIFDGNADDVWVGLDEVAEILATAILKESGIEIGLTITDLCDSDMRARCAIVEYVAENIPAR